MILLISDHYRRLNAEMHEQKQEYGVSGRHWAEKVDKIARACEADTVLDYGCGQGTLRQALLADALPPYRVLEYDPAIPGKMARPIRRVDFVVCGDVLEHVEPDCLYEVLDDIRDLARKAVFLVVATAPARKHLPDGRNAHLIVEPPSWWLRKILDRWHLDAFQDFGHAFACTGRTF